MSILLSNVVGEFSRTSRVLALQGHGILLKLNSISLLYLGNCQSNESLESRYYKALAERTKIVCIARHHLWELEYDNVFLYFR